MCILEAAYCGRTWSTSRLVAGASKLMLLIFIIMVMNQYLIKFSGQDDVPILVEIVEAPM